MKNERGTRAKILCLDDDPDIIMALTEVLEGEGYDVECRATRDPADVRAVLPDLLMIDCPPGHEREVLNFLQLVRLRRETAKIPVILGTSSMRHIEPAMLLDEGIHVLLRPFDIDKFLRLVREILTHRAFDEGDQP
jgi:DNA-binding response OmpR family regulator